MTLGMNRRMFLRGTGGAAMAIPFLPSLLSRAFAADPKPGPTGQCFLAMSTTMGEVWGKNMYPDQALLTQTMNYAGRDVRYGALPTVPDNKGNVVWSAMCTARKELMTPALAQKFNVIRGLDVPYNFGHHEGIHLGNNAGNVGGTAGIPNDAYMVPTIDQFMAWSPSFYTAEDISARMTQRSFGLDHKYMSWNYANPAQKSGRIVKQPTLTRNQQFYDFLFSPGTSLGGIDKPIVDRIKQSYDLLKKDPRISYGDKDRLEQHVQRMFEIERQLKVAKVLSEQQNLPVKSAKDSDDYFKDPQFEWTSYQMKAYCDLMADMIVAAFSTGTSRIGTWGQDSCKFVDTKISDWHGNVSHNGFGATQAQQWALVWNQGTFEYAFVTLAAKLDAVSTPDGGTLLDHCLLMLTNEAGQLTHQSGCVNYPVVMAGSAGGYFNTGMYVDYTDQNIVYDMTNHKADRPGLISESPGLYYQQFLANALMSMGVPAKEWEHFTEFTSDGPQKSTPTKGYGFHYVTPSKAQDYAKAKLLMSDKLPVIT